MWRYITLKRYRACGDCYYWAGCCGFLAKNPWTVNRLTDSMKERLHNPIHLGMLGCPCHVFDDGTESVRQILGHSMEEEPDVAIPNTH